MQEREWHEGVVVKKINHKDKPTITSMEAVHEVVFADSYPSVTRNGSGGGIGDVADAPSSTVTRKKRARTNNSS